MESLIGSGSEVSSVSMPIRDGGRGGCIVVTLVVLGAETWVSTALAVTAAALAVVSMAVCCAATAVAAAVTAAVCASARCCCAAALLPYEGVTRILTEGAESDAF